MLPYPASMMLENQAGYPYGFPGVPDANTLFLCRFGLPIPTDEVTGTVATVFGNASTDTANGQLLLDGNGDYCTFADQGSQFDPISTNWTLEWYAIYAAAGDGCELFRGTAGDIYQAFQFSDGSNGFYNQSSGGLILDTPPVNSTLNIHYAVCRDNSVWRMYSDGTLRHVNNAGATVPSASAADLYMGRNPFFPGAAQDWGGKLGRVKFSNICRYPDGTTFTPPGLTDV